MAAPTTSEDNMENVELGFLEVTDYWRLRSKYFPSKVGGRPSWLNLRDLPTSTRCGICDKPLTFLLQVYAPDTDDDDCFHRTIFVFLCQDAGCCKPDDARNFAVFRCQLPRENEFYSNEPPPDDDTEEESGKPDATDYGPLCVVCGHRGPKRCARCHTSYCCKEHQTTDWHMGHKEICKVLNQTENLLPASRGKQSRVQLLPEFEIVTEEEEYKEKESTTTLEGDTQQVAKFGAHFEAGDVKDLEDMATADDKHFRRFRKRIDSDPEQVLRYQRGGIPLWVSSHSIPKNEDIPDCSCGAQRQFEFQIMPQLLNHLKLDSTGASVDWGTLAIYTCTRNCNSEGAYHQEFVWKQDFAKQE